MSVVIPHHPFPDRSSPPILHAAGLQVMCEGQPAAVGGRGWEGGCLPRPVCGTGRCCPGMSHVVMLDITGARGGGCGGVVVWWLSCWYHHCCHDTVIIIIVITIITTTPLVWLERLGCDSPVFAGYLPPAATRGLLHVHTHSYTHILARVKIEVTWFLTYSLT